MGANLSRMSIPDDALTTHRLLVAAGTAFGLVYGVSFALLTWGYDGFVLSAISADLPWGKLLLGLPISVLICIVVARRAISASALTRFVLVWPLANGVLAVIAAHGILGATNVLVWATEPRLWRLPVFTYGRPDAIRTGIIVAVQVLLGASVGMAQNLTVDWAWDRATPTGRLSWRSWMVMLLCIPLAIFPAITVNDLLHRPLRTPQQTLADYLDLVTTKTADEAAAAGVSLSPVRGLQERLSERYTTHLVGFDPDSDDWFSGSVDAAFDNGLVMRCLIFGDSLVQCRDVSQQLTTWMGDLVEAGLGGVRRWETGGRLDLIVGDDIVAWLTDRRHRLSHNYTVSWEVQRGGWVLVSAQVDTGFKLGCYFTGARPVVVDRCVQMRQR